MATVIITSAYALTAPQKTEAKKVAAKKLGHSDFELQEMVDASLIGGLTMQIGSKMYDASIRGQLETLRR